LLVLVLGRVRVVQGDAAHRAQPAAVGAAQELQGERQGERVVCPPADLELVPVDIRAAQLLILSFRLIHLASVDFDGHVGIFETPHAWPRDMGDETHANGVSSGRSGHVQAGRDGSARDDVALPSELQLAGVDLEIEAGALTRPERESSQVDAVISRCHSSTEVSGRSDREGTTLSAQFHIDPETYLDAIRAEVPRYDELQEATIEAIPFAPRRVLELGVGTGETTRRLLERYPGAKVTGLDAQPEMVFKARELGIEVRLARMEDPLPDGPWDLVVSVLSVHHVTNEQKQDLFRRVREQSRSLVMGDVVIAEPQVAPLEEGVDFPARAEDLVEWCGGEIAWRADDLAVIRAVYD